MTVLVARRPPTIRQSLAFTALTASVSFPLMVLAYRWIAG